MSYLGPNPNPKVGTDEIGTDEIEDGAIGNADLANNSFTFEKIDSNTIASQVEAELGSSAVKFMTPQRTRQALDNYFGEIVTESITVGTTVNEGDTIITPSQPITSVNNMFVFFDGVYQATNTYTVDSNGDLELNAGLPAQVENIDIIYGVNFIPIGTPSDGTVTIAKLASGLIASQAEAEAGTANNKLMTPERTQQVFDKNNIIEETEKSLLGLSTVEYTSIPSDVKRITINIFRMATDVSGQNIFLRLGDSAGLKVSGYHSSCNGGVFGNVVTGESSTVSLIVWPAIAGTSTIRISGSIVLTKFSPLSNIWIMSGNLAAGTGQSSGYTCGGSITLTGALDRLTFNVNGTSEFNNGIMNITYER